MAPLNPNAPFYFPCYYYSCYSSAPSPPPPPFPFYFDHSPSPPPFTATATAAAFFYSYSSLPNASANLQCYYEAPLYTVQSQVKTKQWMSMPAASGFEGREEPWLQFPIIDKYEQDHAVENYKGKESHAGFCYPNPKAVMKGGDNNSSSDLVSLKRVWIPKHRWQNRMFALPAADVFEFKDDDDVEDEDRTTVMMKNLPNKLLRNKLMEMLDEHCFQVNQKIKVEGGDGHDSILSEFDFLYLPMDFDSGSNLGYAFVNFTSAAAARRLYRAYQNKAWDTVLGSRKICEVTYARIQGLLPLQKRFKNSIFICDSDDYLPVYFTPSRNGDRYCQTEEHFVGRRVSRG